LDHAAWYPGAARRCVSPDLVRRQSAARRLAKWLATDPKVLILDSPTVGVDVRNKQGIYELVRRLADQGVAILLISDEVPEVYYNSDRILHMRDGRIVNEFIPGATDQRALSDELYA
jgi:simple sugar transport system ATP-binding protein